MKLKTIIFLVICMWTTAQAQSFDQYFTDRTLRLDYIFEGNVNEQHIAINQLNVSNRWYGKRQRLAELPIQGNGQTTVRDHKSHLAIYRNSFSTLFQEWLTYPEAQGAAQAFENIFLIPMPKDTVDITIELRDNRQKISASYTHMIVPSDIMIRHIGTKPIEYTTLQQASDTTKCIHIAFVAEGYTKDEMSTYINDAHIATEAIFTHEPFKSMRNKFNVVAVKSASLESGTSSPASGVWKNTVLGSHFDTFYSSRYLTTLNLKNLHNILAGIPYEHIIILVNTNQYGGGGIFNSYNLAMSHHLKFRPVVVHEFGHSFAGLADEYAYEFEQIPMYPHDVEPWEQNITTKVDFHDKWENLIGKDHNAGFYEGAGYCLKNVFRAYPDCRMRTNENPEFCAACRQAITKLINFYTE